MSIGRPALYADRAEARRAANRRAADRAQASGLVQRSVRLPADTWSQLRAARASGETSDAETLSRLLKTRLR